MICEPLLSEFRDDADMQELLDEFVGRFADTCRQLRGALDQGDLEVIRRLAHQYKGSGDGYGYPEISACGARLEEVAKRACAVDPSVLEATEKLIGGFLRAQAGHPGSSSRPPCPPL